MISWIQRTFQHHFRLIFAVLLIGMVIPFIFTIGSTPGVGRTDRKAASRDFFGHNLLSQEEDRRLMDDAHLSAELQYGASASAEQIQAFMLQRVAALHLADELHLPEANPTEVSEFIKGLRIFAGPDGQFDNSKYELFRSSLKPGSGLSQGDIYRVLADDVRMAKLQRLMAGPGYVMPFDVKDVLAKDDTSWTVSTASIDYAGYNPGLTISDAEVTKFFTDNIFRYTVAPRVAVDAVIFPSAAYTAGITVTASDVRQLYESNPARFPKPAPAKGAPAVKSDPAADFAAVEPQVRQALVDDLAKRAAVKAASDLAYALYDGKVTPASLDSFLAAHKAVPRHLAPFTSDAGPGELGGSREVATAAFELNATRFYSEGLPTPSGAVVLLWKNSLPAHDPAFAEVRDKVRADALDNKKRLRFVEFGRALQAGTERGLKSGLTFEKAAAAAAADEKLTFKSYPAFTLRQRPKDVDPAVFGALDTLAKGGVSAMDAVADKGVIVYAADKQVPDVSASNPRYQQIRLQLAAYFAQADATSEMHEIVDDELRRSESAAK